MDVQDEIRDFFTAGIEANMNALYSVALRLTRNSADAQDLVAEAVTRAWAAIGTLTERSLFRAWMFRILRNCFVSDCRRRAVRPVESSYHALLNDEQGGGDVASLLVEESDEFLDWWANPERHVSNELLGRQILAAIESLPEAFQATILLVNVDGLSYDEAAAVLGVPPGTVRSRMKRGRTLLQKALWQQASEAGLSATLPAPGDGP
jgi:RNA polymerase sigma-70 factor (ECF subfamily)